MRQRRLTVSLVSIVLVLTLGFVIGFAMTGPSASADPAPRRIVNGWLPYWSMPASLAAATGNGDVWSTASPFWYQATAATAITRFSGAGDAQVLDALHGKGIQVLPTVTETLDAKAMAAMLGDPVRRAAHVQTLVGIAATAGYDGVDLDYESMNFGGTATDRAAVRSGFVTFVKELGAALDARGKLLSITVGARTRADDPNWAVHDYAGLAPSADRFRIMAYDAHWRGGPAGAVAPAAWVEKVVAYAVTAVPAGKVEVGVPLYGYDWPVDPAQADGYGTATALTYAKAEALRAQHGAARQWSSADAAPSFTYTDAAGVPHVVWYNDADSTRAKMTLVGRYGVRGLAFWAVGSEDARQWPALRDYAVQKTTALSAAAPSAVTYGTKVTVSGKLTAASSGAAVAGQAATLQWRPAGSTTWQRLATATTSSTGAVALSSTPTTSGSFRFLTASSWSYAAATSPVIALQVRWRATAAYADATVRKGTAAILGGSVAPVRPGTAVQRQRLVNGAWKTVAASTVGADGTYSFSFTWHTAGTYSYRVRVPGTTLNATGTSPTVKLSVS